MRRHRTIILIVGWLAAFAAAPSGAALASSLLSGYGGPGQGNQAILGSALLKRPGGGSGSSGSGDSSSLASNSQAPSSTTAAPSSTAETGTASTGRSGKAHKARSHAKGARGGSQAHRSASGSSSAPSIAEVYAAAERNGPAPSTPALGLSGSEFLLIVLALIVLALIGVLSRRLMRVPAATSSRGLGGD